MIDNETVNEFKAQLCDRFTASELVDLMDIQTEDIVERFLEEVLRFDFSESL